MKHFLALSVATASTVVLAGCGSASDAGVFRSTDGGVSYLSSSTVGLEDNFADLSVTALAANPTAPSTVYAGLAERGMVISDDAGATWRQTVLTAGTPSAFAVSPGGTDVYMAYLLQVIVTRDGGQTFDTLYSGPEVVTAVTVNPASPETIYAGTAGGTIVRSTNAGRTWNVATVLTSAINDLLISPAGGALVVATTSGIGVAQDGVTIVDRSPTIGGGARQFNVTSVAQSAEAGSPILAAGDLGLFVSTDLGATWTQVLEPVSSEEVALSDVDVVASNSSQVVIVGGTNVAKSDDGGKTWLTRGIATGRTVARALIVDPRTVLLGVAGEAKSFVERTLGT